MITGTTSHKLDLITTYDKNNPYQVGVNGVTHVEYDPNDNTKPISVKYTIGDINYHTVLIKTASLSSSYPTTFSTTKNGFDFDDYFSIKEESKMGLVFPPKIKNELFIERMSLSVFERYSRLSEIKNLGKLIDYRNGYYNIIENR
jgi:hypothetical protein